MGRRMSLLAGLLLSGCAGNLQTVDDGGLYRAYTMSAEELQAAVRDKGIRTVVNLDGFAPESESYRECAKVLREERVRQVDLAFNHERPDREEVIRLLETYRDAPRPILLQSSWPGNEVRLASAIYRLAELGQPKETARKDLRWWQSRYSPLPRHRAHDQFLYEWRNKREFYETYDVAESVRPGRPRPVGPLPETDLDSPRSKQPDVRLGVPAPIGR